MMQTVGLLLALLCGVHRSFVNAQYQGCSSSFTETQVQSLIASNYVGSGQGTAPTITLQLSPAGFKFRVVCLSSSGIRNQYRFVSIVAYFTTSDTAVSPSGVPVYVQFEFECVGSVWSATSSILDSTSLDRTQLTTTASAISVANRTDCSYCLKPVQSPRQSDQINHCYACTGCTSSVCFLLDTVIPNFAFTTVCCNVYLSDGITCAPTCPAGWPTYYVVNGTCEYCSLMCVNGNYYPDHCGCNCTAFFTGSQCNALPDIIPFSVQPHLCQWRDPKPDTVPTVRMSTAVYRNQLFH
eukprot:Em0005g1345a